MNYRLLISLLVLLSGLSTQLQAQYDAEVISSGTHYSVNAMALTEKVEIVIKINNKDGLDMAEVAIPYTSKDIISDIKAQVEDESGVVLKKLKKKEIVDASSISGISLYEDDRLKRFKLTNATFPFVIRYSYERQSKEFLQICNWTPVIAYNIPVRQAILELEYPTGFKFRVSERKMKEGTATQMGHKTKLTWVTSYDAENWESESLGLPVRQTIPRVEIIPENFKYGLTGSFESWSSYGQWLEKISKGLHNLPGSQKQQVQELIADIESPEEKVKALYYYMQDNTRYINVAIGIGGMKPYPASYVAVNKYGDCKALTNYMQALLKEAGIDSYCVDVFAGSVPETGFDEEIPMQAFNHVILAVPMEKDTIWLENTDNTSPFNYLGTFTQNRKGLWVNGAKSQIVDIPGLKPDEVGADHEINIAVKSEENITASIISTYKGKDFERLSYLNEQDLKNEFGLAINRRHPYSRATFDVFKLLEYERDDKALNFIAKMDLKPYTRTFGDTKALFLPKVRVPSLERPNQRKTPLLLPTPIRQHDNITVNSENGVVLLFEVEDQTIESAFGRYSLTSENSEEGVKIIRKLDIKNGLYSLDQYEAFYQFLQKIKKAERKTYLKLKST